MHGSHYDLDFFSVLQMIQRTNTMLCASMCKTNPNCETYFVEASQCHEGEALSLIGSSSNLPSSKEVYIEQNIYANNKGERKTISNQLCIWNIFS